MVDRSAEPSDRSVPGQHSASAVLLPAATQWDRVRLALGRVSAQSAYLAIAIIWGLVLCVLIPPFQQFDEVAHYYRAWSISTGQLAPDASSRVTLPDAVASLPWRLNFVEVGEGRAPYSPRLTVELLGDSTLGRSVRTICFANNQNPLGHLPAAVGVGVARVAGLSPLAAMYAARIATLLAAAIVVSFAIRLLPFGKPLFVIVGLLPMTMTQFTSVNPDALTIAGAMFFFALVLHLRERRQLTTAALVVLVVVGVIGLNIKPGYQALCLLGLLIPSRSFESRRRWLVWMGILVVGVIGLAGVTQVLTVPSSHETIAALYGTATQVDPSAQTNLVLSHPGAFLSAMRATAGTMSIGIATNMIGILGRGFIPLSQMAVLLVVTLLMATLVATRDGPTLEWWGRILVVAVCCVTTVALAFAMYIGATSVGASEVAGLQGRYFIPLFAVGVFAIQGLRRPPRWVVPVILIAVAIALAGSTLVSLLRYYY